MKNWNLKQLKISLLQDLNKCNTQLERDCCKAIGGKEIINKAKDITKTRKLTPGEASIASQFGYKAHN